MIMCRMTRPSGNLQRAGVAGYTFTRTVSDPGSTTELGHDCGSEHANTLLSRENTA
jgi:hypothetical protein